MAIDLGKLQLDLDKQKVAQGEQDRELVAKVTKKLKQSFPSDELSQFEDDRKEFLGKIASIPDEVLQELITNLMKNHEDEEQLTIVCHLSVPWVDIKIKSDVDYEGHNTFDYYYLYGFHFSFYRHNYAIDVGNYQNNTKGFISIEEPYYILDEAFYGLCKTIAGFDFISTGHNQHNNKGIEHRVGYEGYLGVDEFDPIDDRLNEFGLEIISHDYEIDENKYKLYFRVKNPLFDN